MSSFWFSSVNSYFECSRREELLNLPWLLPKVLISNLRFIKASQFFQLNEGLFLLLYYI